MKRTWWKKKPTTPMKRSKLRVAGVSDSAHLKKDIQAKVREIVIKRDGGCILRNYPQTGLCGRYKANGELILQAEHLNTRARMATFADTRLIVCLCERHHIFWKPQYADEYFRLVKEHIGKERTALLERVQNDYTAHKVDLKLELLALEMELNNIIKREGDTYILDK